ncbi:MAG TPA: hypothetical protein VFQ53_07570 [Kofleriaceae bacterium]|nr:hypothetical protein [Kofleriaceae bacterium]
MRQLAIDLLGGWTERRMRRHREVDELPWGTLDPSAADPVDVALVRAMWTNGVFTEYASAAAFSQLATALVECGAPIDLTATCADIVVDEMTHVELAARVVAELGGAVPYEMDLDRITQLVDDTAPPLLRAAELAITTSCVGESLSLPALRSSRSLAGGGLLHAVLDRLVRDEGPHAQLGIAFLAWAGDRLTAADRAQLAAIALRAVAVYAPLWQTSPDADYRALMTSAVRDKIDARLVRHDIVMDRARLAQLLG